LSHNIAIKQKVSLGAGFFATSFVNQSLMVLAIPFYQMTLGVDPFLLSIVLILPFLLASLLNPWVGQLSDQFYSRWGRRRPFIMVASWVSGLLFALVWMVPEQWSANSQLAYFALTSFLLYCAYVFLNIPMTCLSYELSRDPQVRLGLMGFTTYFVKLGTLLYQWLFPIAQLALFSSVFLGIKVVGWTIGIGVIAIMGMLPALFCQEQQFVRQKPSKLKLNDSFNLLKKNKALVAVLLVCVLQLGGGAFSASMDYYLLVYYVHSGDIAQGAIDKGWLSTAYTLLGMLAIPLLIRWAAFVGKSKVLQGVFLITALGGVLKWFLFVPGVGMWILVDAILGTLIWSAMTTILPAMLADISDKHTQKTGQQQEGRFVALFTLVTNLSAALAILIAGLCLNFSGFNAALGAEQTETSISNLRLILSLGTCFFSLAAWLIVRSGLHSNNS
jgi:glycoside/pentoside/hexuronide:cation symporter, GPH family